MSLADEPERGWLRHQYLTLGKSARSIARELEVSHSAVGWLLRDLGIPVRSQAEATSLAVTQSNALRADNKSHHWKGGRSAGYTYKESRRVLCGAGIPKRCAHCGTTERLVPHHKDGNRAGNVLENLMWLCRSCHTTLHWAQGDYQ